MMRKIILMLGLMISFNSLSNNPLQVFVQKKLYPEGFFEKLNIKNVKFDNYYFLGRYFLDRNNVNEINYKQLSEGLDYLIPNVNDAGVLCIDLENQIYKDLKYSEKKSASYGSNTDKIIEMLKFVKKHRPNLKIGLYGIPFTLYWEGLDSSRYGEIIPYLDFLCPHLYLYYPDSQFGEEANLKYIQKNIENFNYYKHRYNIPIFPFVWLYIHPSNKKYGMKVMSTIESKRYIENIINSNVDGNSIDGILWWDHSGPKKEERIELINIIKKIEY